MLTDDGCYGVETAIMRFCCNVSDLVDVIKKQNDELTAIRKLLREMAIKATLNNQ